MSGRIYAVRISGGYGCTARVAEIVSGAVLKRTDKQLTVERCEAGNYRTIAPIDAPQTPADAVARYVAEREATIARAQAEIAAARKALAEYQEKP